LRKSREIWTTPRGSCPGLEGHILLSQGLIPPAHGKLITLVALMPCAPEGVPHAAPLGLRVVAVSRGDLPELQKVVPAAPSRRIHSLDGQISASNASRQLDAEQDNSRIHVIRPQTRTCTSWRQMDKVASLHQERIAGPRFTPLWSRCCCLVKVLVLIEKLFMQFL
jgi:hypothetical protein